MTLRYVGSKYWLRGRVEAMVPADTETLIAPFFGSGKVEYHIARCRPQIQVQGSDSFGPIVNFHKHIPIEGLRAFVGVQMEKDAVKRMAKDIFQADEYTSAVWAFVALYNSYLGKFGTFARRGALTDREVNQLKQLELPNVQVRQEDCFRALSNLPTNRKICLYLDPPYITPHKHCKYYRGERQTDLLEFHQRLAQVVRELGVPFVLSVNDSPEIRTMYQGFSIEALKNPRSNSKVKVELLIHNLTPTTP